MKSEYTIDPAHSSAQSTVRHMMMTNVRGAFSGIQGSITYDPHDVRASILSVVVGRSTVNTLDAQRDAHLKGADFLDVVRHPDITFQDTNVKALGAGKLCITGDLTIHGVAELGDVGPTSMGPCPGIKSVLSANAREICLPPEQERKHHGCGHFMRLF